jgi:hypothetical protein
MTTDRDPFLPAGPRPALPPALRAALRALSLDLARLARLLADHARREEARAARRRRRKGGGGRES